MSNDPRDKFESLLDDALASYARQEPRPDSKRARSRAYTPTQALDWRFRAGPGSYRQRRACCYAQAFSGHGMPGRPEQSKPAPVARATAPLRSEAPQTPRIVKRSRRRKVLPRLPQFPAPVPVTNAERALLAFVAQAPKEAQEALIESDQRRVEPIRIEEIKIEPLP